MLHWVSGRDFPYADSNNPPPAAERPCGWAWQAAAVPRPVPPPPAPERRPTVLSHHGHQRTDPWHWLRQIDDPAVMAHLEAENAYTRAALRRLSGLRRTVYAELRARIHETDISVPVRRGPWWYYTRTRRGDGYPVHCRRPARGARPPLHPRRDDREEVLLDQNVLARGSDYLSVGVYSVSPDHRWLAYGVDRSGAERFELRFARLGGDGGSGAGEVLDDVGYGLAWDAGSGTVFYVRTDEAMRPYQLWRHTVGDDPGGDQLVLEEADARFSLSVGRARSGELVMVSLDSTDSSETWLLAAGRPAAPPRLVDRRREGIRYGVEHLRRPGGPGWLLVLTNEGARDFRLTAAPADDPGPPDGRREVVPHRPGTRLEDVDAFDGWLVLSERRDAQAGVRVAGLLPGADPFGPDLLARSWAVPGEEHPATTWAAANPEPDQTALRYEQTSLASPRATWEVPMGGGAPALLRRQPVRGYRREDYRTERITVPSMGGVGVPVSLLRRADAPPGPAPCLLYGYGAYEHSLDPSFSALRLPLVDRGAVYAVAHVRGGGELGRGWYEDGRRQVKQHTFDDFAAVARHLVATGVTSHDRLAVRGASAGGLLIGAVMNQAPGLCRAAVAEVPFVDCLTTMLDPSLPLTVGEYEEWGDPGTDPDAYRTIAAYSPYDNVADRRYPDTLVTAGLHDNRVGYWEPAKWVARLRAADPENRVFLRLELGAGHGGRSGRYDAWEDEAFVLAFVADALGLGPPTGG